MAVGHSFLRRCTRLPLVAAPAVIALGAALALHILPREKPAETIGGYAADGTGFFSNASTVHMDSYALALRHSVPGMSSQVSFLRNPQTGSLVVAAPFYKRIPGAKDAMEIDACLFTLEGDTLARYSGCLLLAPTGRWAGACPEYVVWRPKWEYLPATGVLSENLPMLFLHNLEGIFRWLDPMDPVLRACLTAGRGEVLSVQSQAVTVAPGDTGRMPPIELPYGYEHELALAYRTARGDVTTLRASGGYQNVDRLYRLLNQPRTHAGERVAGLSANAITGSFRGVVAIDPVAARLRWICLTGVTTYPFVVADLNGDGLDEFIISSYSPENGVSFNGMTDAGTAYVICLDWYGHVLWRRAFHGEFLGAQAAVADVCGGDDREVVVVVSSNKPGDLGCAAVLGADGTTIVERRDLGGLYGLVVADLDGNGKAEIVAGAPNGRIVALDGDLETVSSTGDTAHARWVARRLGAVPGSDAGRHLVPCAANDLDGDGEIEIVAASVGWWSPEFVPSGRVTMWDPLSYVVVLGPALEEEARFLVPPIEGEPRPMRLIPSHPNRFTHTLDTDGDGSNEIVMWPGGPGLMVLEVVKREAN
jgi:hypothetical protein